MDPGSEERTLPNMVTVYCPEELHLLDGLGNGHAHCSRVRAATKSVLALAVMDHLADLLDKDGMTGTECMCSRAVALDQEEASF